MPFNVARQYLEQYSKSRGDEIAQGERIRWSTVGASSLSDQLQTTFNREAENGKLSGLQKSKMPDMAKLIAASNQLSWVCGCARDFRLQFIAHKTDKLRTSVDHSRLSVSSLKWVEKGLQRLRELNQTKEQGLS